MFMQITGGVNIYITYLTAKEAGFDYLRSFLAMSPYDLVQRPFNYAIVDEADSILIDEARIPLVIAGKVEKAHGIDPVRMAEVIGGLVPGKDYDLDEYLVLSGAKKAKGVKKEGAVDVRLVFPGNCSIRCYRLELYFKHKSHDEAKKYCAYAAIWEILK